MDKNYKGNLLCPTCGGGDFECNEDKSFVKCKRCGREFHRGYDELLKSNQSRINSIIKDKVEKDIVDDINKAIKGFGNIKLK